MEFPRISRKLISHPESQRLIMICEKFENIIYCPHLQTENRNQLYPDSNLMNAKERGSKGKQVLFSNWDRNRFVKIQQSATHPDVLYLEPLSFLKNKCTRILYFYRDIGQTLFSFSLIIVKLWEKKWHDTYFKIHRIFKDHP